MQVSFERSISSILNSYSQLNEAVDQLLRLWKDRGCNEDDTKALFIFLNNIHYELTLASQIQFLLDKKLPIPWLFVLELYYNNKVHFDFSQEDFLEALFTAASEKDLQAIVKFYKYDNLDSRFDHLRSEWISKELEQKHSRKKEILNKLQMLKHERMLQEERKLFIQALEDFPTDEEILAKYSDFQNRYADNLFQKSEVKKENLLFRLLKRETDVNKDPYVIEMLKLAKKHPEEIYWIAASLFMSECYQACISLLENKDKTESEKWLLLEAYLQNHSYILSLDYARQMEAEYRDFPDLLMSCLYYQAISLEKLGKKQEALLILKSLLAYNKDFKMAQYLFDDWSQS